MGKDNRKFAEENGITIKRISEELTKAKMAQRWRLTPSEPINVKIKRLHPDAVIPTQAHANDAGFDLYAVEDTVIEPGETVLIKTGIAVQLPPGYELQVRPRSGISLKTKLRVANAPGTVDASFTGEVGIIIDNISDSDVEEIGYRRVYGYIDGTFTETKRGETYDTNEDETTRNIIPNTTYIIRRGDRIAQAVIQRLPAVTFAEVDELDETERGSDGYGSTGTNINKEGE